MGPVLMTVIKDILRQYWTQIFAIVAFACAAVRYWRLGNHFEEANVEGIVFALTGLVLVLQGDEWTASPWGDSERLTRDRAWLRRRSFTYRSWTGPVVGGIALIWGLVVLYRL